MAEFIEIPARLQSLKQRKPIYGVGINDADYMVNPKINNQRTWCLYYIVWRHMIERSYGAKCQEKHPTYKGCSVTEEWLTFSNFRAWMKTQDWKDKQLDKDILTTENKVYGPDTCIFVSSAINSLLISCTASRGNYPQGVSFHKPLKKYKAQCCVNGKKQHLGYFATIPAAEYAYLIFKSDLIEQTAYEEESTNNPKLQAALLRHAAIFADKAIALSKEPDNE